MDQFFINLLNGISYGCAVHAQPGHADLQHDGRVGARQLLHAGCLFRLHAPAGGLLDRRWWRAAGWWAAGAVFERWCLRGCAQVRPCAELLVTFGLSHVRYSLELVQLIVRGARVPTPPGVAGHGLHAGQVCDGVALSGACGRRGAARRMRKASRRAPRFPLNRAFLMLVGADADRPVADADAHAHRPGDPGRADAPGDGRGAGHNVPRVFMLVFGAGCGDGRLAGVIGGITFVTEPAMAANGRHSIIFVVVDRRHGLLAGAFRRRC